MDQNLNNGQVHIENQVSETPTVSHKSPGRFGILKNKKFLVLVLILLALPLTVGLVMVRSNTQSSAAPNTVVSLNPAKVETVVGNNVQFDVLVSPGENLVNFLKLGITYDPNYFEPIESGFVVDPESPLTILDGPVISNGIVQVVLSAGSDPTNVIKIPTKVGSVILRPKSSTGNTGSQINFNPSQTEARSINGEQDQFNENVISSMVPATVIVSQGNIMPTPTSFPTITGSLTKTPTPTRAPNTTPTPTNKAPTITPTKTPTPTPPLTSSITQPVARVILSPNADAFVRSTAPNQNFGTASNLENDLSPDEISYLRFNLSTLAGKTIKKATLVLWTSDATNATLNLRNADDSDWTEGGITYNKKPGFVNTVTSFTAKTLNSSVSIDVTSRINSKKGTRATFGIKSLGDDAGAFHSRNSLDNAKRPQLIVEY